ncbi:MAG: tripartite tricarboxylate transporter permease [Deltaproteobacteria bacterium]|nr:tripartite tricarboxylate transporter permease [Deltaproteobacteria bacterium]
MLDYNIVIAGLSDAFSLYNLLFVLFGVIVGQFVGALPGTGPVMAMAIAIPFTFTLDPLIAIAFLMGVNKGGLVGGAVPAILINTPGTPDAAATTLDGFPMTQQGKSEKALKMALYSSVSGDAFSDIVLFTVSPLIAMVALKMGPMEIFALMVFAFSVIAGLVSDSMTKGITSTALGLFCATVGLDPEHSTPRFIFGFFELYDGLPLVSVALGMLAVPEIFRRLARIRGKISSAVAVSKTQKREDRRVSLAEYWSCRYTILRGSVIGTIMGAIPGLDSSAAAFMTYASMKQTSKDPDSFGRGNIHGVAATESANSSVSGANLIPLLTLGIPGNIAAALIISALMIHGVQPGPLLFREQGRLIYGLFGALMMANVLNLMSGLVGLRVWSRVIRAPESFIFPTALVLCIVGVYMATGGLLGVTIMFIFALISYLMHAFGYSAIVFVIGFFLGERFELTLSQSLNLIDGELIVLLHHPIALALFALAFSSVYWFSVRPAKRNRK